MSQIELKNVTKAYYADRKKSLARVVLDDISLKIEEGEFVALVGPSGCGKTTVLNLIAGFEAPTLGTVEVNGSEVKSPSPERGVIFQEYSLLPWMDVKSNIELALECQNVPAKDRADKISKALGIVRMSEFADSRPNILSGGMKQRVAIARLIAMDSKLFLMDEPFSALDEQTRKKLDEDIVEIWKNSGKTAVMVTHSIEEALIVSTRIIMFSDSPGKIIGEWHLPKGMDRNPYSEEFVNLKKEIMEWLPACPCTRKERRWIAIE